MGYSHQDVIDAFLHGKQRSAKNLFTDGQTIYSYGHHFPIAKRLGPGVYLFNTDNRSPSTSGQQWSVRRALEGADGHMAEIYECTTEEIKEARPGKPVVLTKTAEHSTVEAALENIVSIFRARGMKRIPKSKWLDILDDDYALTMARQAARDEEASVRAMAPRYAGRVSQSRFGDAMRVMRRCLADDAKPVRMEALSMMCQQLYRLTMRQVAYFEKHANAHMSDLGLEYFGGVHVRGDASYSMLLFWRDSALIAFGSCAQRLLPWLGAKEAFPSRASTLQEMIRNPRSVLGEDFAGEVETNVTIDPEHYESLAGLAVAAAL